MDDAPLEVLPAGDLIGFPTFVELSAGPMRRLPFPGADAPTLMHYVISGPARNIIAAVRRWGVGDSWYVDRELDQYVATGLPVVTAWLLEERLKHRASANPELTAWLDRLEATRPRFLSFQVGEWENWMTWADRADTPFSRDNTVFAATAAEMDRMGKAELHALAVEAFRAWKEDVRGRIHSVNGFSLWYHLGAEVGEDFVGVETGENIPSAQVQRAFARGAARQFGLPLYEQISQWYHGSVPSGAPLPLADASPGGVHSTMVGPNTGHSVSMLERMWYTAWFSGATAVCVEAASGYLFTVPYTSQVFPEETGLSEYGKRARGLAEVMKTLDLVPYAPVAVLVSRTHGQMTFWGKPWGHVKETTGDEMTKRFFDQLFPRQSWGPGAEERYLCPSPFSDGFDVIVNDASRASWGSYRAILAVGDISWTPEDIAFLSEYVRAGGILALNEANAAGWDRAFLGLRPEAFQPAADARVAIPGFGPSPILIRRDVGAGAVFVSALRPEPPSTAELSFPTALLGALADRFLPVRVSGEVETQIARTPRGWALLLVNNGGFKKLPTEKEETDPARTQHVEILCRFPVAEARDVLSGGQVERHSLAAGSGVVSFGLEVKPGGMRLLELREP